MHKRFLLTIFHISICICTNGNDNQKNEQIETTPFKDNPLVKQLKGILGDKCGLDLLQKLQDEGKEEGRKEGFQLGYEAAESKFFMRFFECFVNREKTDFEVYKDGITKSVYNDEEYRKSLQVDNLKFPDDIKEMIKNYDNWVLSYDVKLISNGNNGDGPPAKSIPSMEDLLEQLQIAFVNWYLIVKCEEEKCPKYIDRIRQQLKEYYKDNLQKYKSIEDVYLRFAASMSRGYKIMCVIHHKLERELRKESDKNGTALFTDILFQCVPDFFIDYEQFNFYTFLRHALQPKIAILQHFIIENRPKSPKDQRKLTLIPYDNSKWCNAQNLSELSSSHMSTVKFYEIKYWYTIIHHASGKTVNKHGSTMAGDKTQH